MEQEVFGLVVGDVDVGLAVAVKIRSGHAHGAALVSADARIVRYVGKSAVAIVVVEPVGVAS